MHVEARDSMECLQEMAKQYRHTRTWPRLRAVILAKQGDTARAIARALGFSRRAVQAWVAAYNRGGLEALPDRPHPGRTPHLPHDEEVRFLERIDTPPRPEVGKSDLPDNGALSWVADGSFTYTPNAGFTGPDGFTYQSPAADTAVVKVTVAGPGGRRAGASGSWRVPGHENVSLGAGNTVTGWLDGSGHGNNLVAQGNPQLLAGATPDRRGGDRLRRHRRPAAAGQRHRHAERPRRGRRQPHDLRGGRLREPRRGHVRRRLRRRGGERGLRAGRRQERQPHGPGLGRGQRLPLGPERRRPAASWCSRWC